MTTVRWWLVPIRGGYATERHHEPPKRGHWGPPALRSGAWTLRSGSSSWSSSGCVVAVIVLYRRRNSGGSMSVQEARIRGDKDFGGGGVE